MQITTVTKRYAKSPTEDERAKVKELIAKNRKEDEKLVKGIFEFSDAGGGWFEFNCRLYPGEILKLKIYHGETVDLPRGIVKLINNTYRKIRKYDMSKELDQHAAVPTVAERTARIRFIPLDAF